MFAVVLFAMFGALMAAIAGVISTGTDVTKQLILNRAEATRSFFEQAADVYVNRITLQEMEIAPATTCNGTNYPVYDPRPYLCRLEIRQLASWDMGANNLTDAWRADITGVVVRQNKVIAPNVTVPVTAMAFISLGPDRTLGTNLSTSLTTVRTAASLGTATIQDVMRLTAQVDSTVSGTDDIVYTFNNQQAQQRKWDEISGNINKMANVMQQSYMDQYESFRPFLRAYYATPAGQAQIGNPYSWKAVANPGGGTKPSMAVPNLNTQPGQEALGVAEIVDALTKPINKGGSALSLIHGSYSSVSASYPTERDVLVLVLSSTTPWLVNFTKTLNMAQ